ncbi:Oidioi.mRNA.OKI2018_I69.chr1.g242.t1.cds [Oikopleura dioica]|uniref:Oidioi.mRNA.OKI2018_I69.chr1.g242.t1.cds n=1 Tax=Oikopleura dioica TaxID=34765 RepID=A0ABN7SRF6_OIKDI|nr:Oidioi.mRNA.OKI2018_I69.chr1.g242.t1.cds [Oikopleura dioica]
MEGLRVSKLFIYDPEKQHHQGVSPQGTVMERKQEIAKTEPEETHFPKTEPVSDEESRIQEDQLTPIEASEIIQSLIENPGANFGATAKKFSVRKVLT